jgi:hypothetical protein
MEPRILRPGPMSPNGQVQADQPILFTCNACGHQMLIPGGLAPIAAQQHEQRCIGPAVRRILELLEPPPRQDA